MATCASACELERTDLAVVLEKLKRHAEYAIKPEGELRDLARELTDFDKVFMQFSHLLEPVVDKAIDAALIDYRAVFTHSQEEEMAHERANYDMARVFHLPIKLFLSRLKQPIPSIAGRIISNFLFDYGALHAGLTVGNIRIEWGQEGIVEALPEGDVPEDEFVGSVVSRQGHLAQVAVETRRLYSLADREQRIDDKIKLIIDTAEKKKEVLSNLVRVIVHYNLERRYDLFTCNCQHFVRDALAALGIKEPPRFSGQLNNHLEQLKQGKVKIPKDFKNHATLDAYVEQQLQAEPGTLNQHDMEYLLLHYHRIHLNSMPKGDDADRWQCGVPSCKYEHLADRVNRESLLGSQFMSVSATASYRQPTPIVHGHPSSAIPGTSLAPAEITTISSQEVQMGESEQEEEIREELRRQQIAEDEQTAREIAAGFEQERLYSQHADGGYNARVIRKLRKLPEYAEESDEALQQMANSLTENEPFREKYHCFPASVEETTKGYALDAAADSVWIEAERLPHDAAKSKVEERYESVSKFPVKLILRVKAPEHGSAGTSTYDAELETVLLIWDHIFEWKSSSLVIPQPVDLKTLPPALITSVLCGSEWANYVSNQRSKMQTVVKSPTDKLHKREIDLLFKLTTRKDSLIAVVIKTVIDYNRNRQYHERDCNNQHFIQDVYRTVGVKRLPEIRESLGKLLEQSKQLCLETLSRTEFVDHADLDSFICYRVNNNTLSHLNIRDVEYLVGKYFLFHVRNWELLRHPQKWTCQECNCQLKHLEKHLEKLSLTCERRCVLL